MELRHLRYFVAVAEELHFTRAAARLGISPPALTEQIQGLERELGVRLLQRNQRSVALTDAGSRFVDEVRLTLHHAERAELVARRAARGEEGEIAIGYVSSASCTGLLSKAIYEYRGKHPVVSIHIRKLETSRQLDDLGEGRLDIGFLRPPARYPLGISSVIIAQQPTLVVLQEDHKLAALTNTLTAPMLAQEAFIAPDFEREIGIFPHTAELGRSGNFVPRMVGSAPDLFTVVTMVAAGFGIAIVPQSCACIQIPGIVYRPLASGTRLAELSAAFRRDERAPAVKTFIQQLRRMGLPPQVAANSP